MKHTKTLLCLLLALAMLLCAGCKNTDGVQSTSEPAPESSAPETSAPTEETVAPTAGEAVSYQMGDKIQDFTVTTFDGKTVTLSEVLKEKDMVLINIWATWCGPCGAEFPFLQQAYEQYQDRVEVIALSCEPEDTDDVLAQYAAEKGMTFPVAKDTPDLASAFGVDSIPTSIVVDRFGTICFLEAGSQSDADSFINLFELFLGDDYTESIMQYGIPRTKPNVEPSSEAELASALNAEGGSLVFTNDTDEYSWPMVAGEQDGRAVVASSNHQVNRSEAVVNATVNAKAGDAVAVTFKVSSEATFDLMQIRVNGETVKCFGGERDWTTYAYAFDADGEYTVSVAYCKDEASEDGEDTLWIDTIELLSGDAAAAAVDANPTYLFGDATTLTVTNPDAKEIVFDDPSQLPENTTFYIVPGGTADVLLTLAPDVDPETLFMYCNYDGSQPAVLSCQTEEGYAFQSAIDSIETTGYGDSSMCLYNALDSETPLMQVILFANEENVNEVVATSLADENGNATVSWQYADGTKPSTTARPTTSATTSSEVTYTVKYVDQNGQPVAGVTCQVCDDTTCATYQSDENGVCEFTLPPYAYEIHTLKLPEGYEGDTTTITTAPAEGGEMTIELKKK